MLKKTLLILSIIAFCNICIANAATDNAHNQQQTSTAKSKNGDKATDSKIAQKDIVESADEDYDNPAYY